MFENKEYIDSFHHLTVSSHSFSQSRIFYPKQRALSTQPQTWLSDGPSAGFPLQSLGWLFDLLLCPFLGLECGQKQFSQSFKPPGIYFERFKINVLYLGYYVSHTVTAQRKMCWA